MPAPKKPTPEKYCNQCGARLERKNLPNGDLEYLIHFNRRKFCDRRCMAQNFDQRHSASAGWSASHHHARQIMPPGPCNRCGTHAALDVHHRDHNFQNNNPSNLERICRSCHSMEHRKKSLCTICGNPQKGLGYCEKHYQRFKKYGDPLKTKVNQHTPVGLSEG